MRTQLRPSPPKPAQSGQSGRGRPESQDPRRNGDGHGRGSGKPPGRRTLSRASPAAHLWDPQCCPPRSWKPLFGHLVPKCHHQAALGVTREKRLCLFRRLHRKARVQSEGRPGGGGEVAREEGGGEGGQPLNAPAQWRPLPLPLRASTFSPARSERAPKQGA